MVVQGTNMTLADVSTVVENHQPLIGDAVVGDETALMLVVEKFPWANTVEVTHDVEAAIDRALEDRDWQVRQAAEDLRRAEGAHEI